MARFVFKTDTDPKNEAPCFRTDKHGVLLSTLKSENESRGFELNRDSLYKEKLEEADKGKLVQAFTKKSAAGSAVQAARRRRSANSAPRSGPRTPPTTPAPNGPKSGAARSRPGTAPLAQTESTDAIRPRGRSSPSDTRRRGPSRAVEAAQELKGVLPPIRTAAGSAVHAARRGRSSSVPSAARRRGTSPVPNSSASPSQTGPTGDTRPKSSAARRGVIAAQGVRGQGELPAIQVPTPKTN